MAKSKINTRLKFALLENGISQLQLADDLGFDPSLVSKVIRGWERPSQHFMEMVAGYFGVSVEELF